MHVRSRDNLTLLISLFASVMVHVLLLAPVLTAALRQDPNTRALEASFDPASFETPANEIELGIEADTPSTMTWIGHEDYEKHLAQLAEMDQAAFVTEPVGSVALKASSSAPNNTSEPAPSIEPILPTESNETVTQTLEVAQQAPASPRSDEDAATDRTAEDAPRSDFLRTLLPDILALRATSDRADVRVPTAEQPQLGPEQLVAPSSADEEAVEIPTGSDPAPTRRAPSKSRETGEQPTEQPDEASPATEPQHASQSQAPGEQPAAQPPSSPGQPEPGQVSDQESTAFSMTVSLDEIKLGKPIARPGLELKPRRPEFTILQRLTRAPNNPLCQIHFGRDGKPKAAGFVRAPNGELLSTGSPDIDSAVRASLYRWRASGERLESLGEDETLIIEIQIIFHTVRR